MSQRPRPTAFREALAGGWPSHSTLVLRPREYHLLDMHLRQHMSITAVAAETGTSVTRTRQIMLKGARRILGPDFGRTAMEREREMRKQRGAA